MDVREIVQKMGIKTISQKKKCKKAKWLSEEALQIAVKRREAKSKGGKERYTHLNVEFQRIARRDRKAFLSDQCKEIEENNRMERLEISSRKLDIPRECFMQRWAQWGGRNTQKNYTKKIFMTQIIRMVWTLEGLIGVHNRTIQLLQHYWLGHRLGLLWHWMVCLETNRDYSVIFEIAPMYCILDSCWLWWLPHFFLRDSCPQ